MTHQQVIEFLKSLPWAATLVNFEFYDFHGHRQHGSAKVEHNQDGVYVVGAFGCGKTRTDVRSALIEYLGGRELICYQHHN